MGAGPAYNVVLDEGRKGWVRHDAVEGSCDALWNFTLNLEVVNLSLDADRPLEPRESRTHVLRLK